MAEPLSRRDFLKVSGLGIAGFGFKSAGVELPTVAKEPFRGQVKNGEGLTMALERISGKEMKDWGNLELVWKNPNTDCDYHFLNAQAFSYQNIVPLPLVQPGDEIVFGTHEDMEEKLVEPGIFTSKGRVTIDSRIKGVGRAMETYLTVFGGRFDRTVFNMLPYEGDTWKTNTKGNDWVDSEKFKDLMDANPEMKSSEALQQL